VPDTEDESHRPAQFAAALDAIRHARPRTDLVITEIAAPGNLAPYAVALSADVAPVRHGSDSEFGTGRFILLYDPDEPESWGGPFRVVCFAQAPLETDIGIDPFLAEVAWAWLVDALDTRGAVYTAASGTATKILSSGFGELASQGDGAQIELRASWSPQNNDLAAHVEGWGELLCMLAGLPPAGEAPTAPRGPHPAGASAPQHRAETTGGIDLGPLDRIGPSSPRGRRSGPGLHTLEVVTPGDDADGTEPAGVHSTGPDTLGAHRAARETVGMNAVAGTERPDPTGSGRVDDGTGGGAEPRAFGTDGPTEASAPLTAPTSSAFGVADLSARRAARG
jgi:hypothetical protein